MKVCPNCGKQYPDDANFCPVDAGRLELDAGGTQRGLTPAGAASAATVVELDRDSVLGGRFEIVGNRLGGAHTGDVYQAIDRQTGNPCAVKLVHPGVFPNQLLLQRAERELKQLERVDLPEVARVIAHGRRGDQLWIAMEPVSGIELMRLVVENGPMPALAGCQLIRQVAHGLAEAAKQGVIHRDLAAKNVLVGDGGGVKLINFPIAVPLTDRVQGVPEFLSPEQVEGKPADQRSSIYSLGALLYFVVTGRPPFAGEPTDVLRAHQAIEPVRPSRLAPVPEAIEAVIMKALEKASARRFMTLHQMIGELDAVLAGAVSAAATAMAAHGKGKSVQAAPAQTLMGVSSFQLPPGASPMMAPMAPHAPVGQGAQQFPSAGNGGPAGMMPSAMPDQRMDQHVEAMLPRTLVASGEVGGGPAAPRMQPMAIISQPDPVVRPAAVIVPTPPSTPVLNITPAGGATATKGKGRVSQPITDTKGKFRETMWFKKGELDEAAAAAAAAAHEGELVHDKADALPIEDRYRDDGTLNRQDAERLSLRTGHTQVGLQARAEPLARKRVSERELVGELRRGRIWLVLFLLLLAGGIGAAVYYLMD
jgi:hypothetical protein